MSTKIQVIASSNNFTQKTEIGFSYLSNPFAVDMFDVNIVDLTHQLIWRHSDNDYYSIDSINDFTSFKTIVQNSQSSSIVYVLPPNLCFQYCYDRFAGKYHNAIRLKDILGPLTDNMLSEILPINIRNSLIFENSLSKICEESFASSFSFLPDWVELSKLPVLTRANGSKKATTVAYGRYIFTTLQVTKDEQRLFAYLQALHLLKESSVLRGI